MINGLIARSMGRWVLTASVVFATSLAHAGPNPGNPGKAAPRSVVSVMTFNVENLFDTQHDPGKNDYEYLPVAVKRQDQTVQENCDQNCLNHDWSEAVLARKMKRIAGAILQVNGVGPDVLILEEVENLRVLQQLNNGYLKAAGYKTVVLIEGDDNRGIDVGLLSRLPLAGTPQLHRIPFYPSTLDPQWKQLKTRGILETPLMMPNGQKLTVFGLHFPSQAKTVNYRQDAIKALNGLLAKKNPQEMVIAGGDFNISTEEERTNGLFSKEIGAAWTYTHQLGCKGCAGTEVYDNQWNFFDAILFNGFISSGRAPYAINRSSIRVLNRGPFQANPDGTPARFEERNNPNGGVSDHFPVYVELARVR